MSLMSRIGKGLVARSAPKVAKPTAPKPSAQFPARIQVHPGKFDMNDPPPSPPLPMAERRRRIAEGHARRNAPVPTSAPVAPTPPTPPAPRVITPPERRPAPFIAPPPPVEDLVAAVAALPLPVAAAAPSPVAFRPGSPCKAISAATGRQCGLLAGHGTMHRHGNTSFMRVAEPGSTSFSKRDELDAAARSNSTFNPASGEF